MKAKISNINLFVQNVEKARAFYQKVFDLEEIVDRAARPGFVRLQAGECVLSLQDAAAVGRKNEPRGGAEIGFEVEDVKAIAQSLSDAGGTIVELNAMAWGEAADALDLDGHRLTIFQRR